MFDWAQRCTCVFPPIIALKNPHFPQKKSWLDGPPFYSSHDEVEDDNGDDNVDISGGDHGDHGDDNYDDDGDHNDDDNDVVMAMVTMITMFFTKPEAPDQCHDNLQIKTSKLCQVCHCAMSPVHQSFTSRSKDLKLKLWFQKTFHSFNTCLFGSLNLILKSDGKEFLNQLINRNNNNSAGNIKSTNWGSEKLNDEIKRPASEEMELLGIIGLIELISELNWN